MLIGWMARPVDSSVAAAADHDPLGGPATHIGIVVVREPTRSPIEASALLIDDEDLLV